MRKNLYWAVFFLNFTLALSAYTNSLFLAEVGGEKVVGPVYVLASLFLLGSLSLIPYFLRLNPKSLRGLTLGLAAGKLAAIILLIKLELPLAIIGVFIVFDTLGYLVRFNLDLYLEHTTSNGETGRVRGAFLTFTNLAWLISPLLVGWILGTNENYRQIYLFAGVAMLPVLYLIGQTKKITPQTISGNFFTTLEKIFHHRNNHYREIYRILSIDFLLNFFYALMVIYLPLHLHNNLGFAWPEIGVILTIMLLPFVLVTYPLGWLADKLWGEKEFLVVGFLIISLATLAVAQIGVNNLWLWAGILFLTRIGAATIEIMKETYLFKKIDAKDVDVLSLSRNLLPLAYLIAPLVATGILFFFPLPAIFTFLGIFMFLGVGYSLKLKDTR